MFVSTSHTVLEVEDAKKSLSGLLCRNSTPSSSYFSLSLLYFWRIWAVSLFTNLTASKWQGHISCLPPHACTSSSSSACFRLLLMVAWLWPFTSFWGPVFCGKSQCGSLRKEGGCQRSYPIFSSGNWGHLSLTGVLLMPARPKSQQGQAVGRIVTEQDCGWWKGCTGPGEPLKTCSRTRQ